MGIDPAQGGLAAALGAAFVALLKRSVKLQAFTIRVADQAAERQLSEARAELARLGAEITVLKADLARAKADLDWTWREIARLRGTSAGAPIIATINEIQEGDPHP